MKLAGHISAPALVLPFLFAAACQQLPKTDPSEVYKGVVINEIAAHEDIDGIDTWVEIVNTSGQDIALDGLSFFITDEYLSGQDIGALSGTLAAGERKVYSTADGALRTGIASDAAFTLALGPDAQHPVDSYERAEDAKALGYFGSYQRIPDATGEWKYVTYSSEGRANELFDLSKTRPTAVWAWGSHLSDLTADDGAKLRNLKKLGYDHLLMNYAGFENKNYRQQAIKCIRICDEIGLAVHVWLQAFWDGDWVSPIDDESKTFREDIFERIRTAAARYIETWGVKGVHLDYIRFGGTASKHNWTTEVNSVNAVNRCCREIRETCDSYGEGLVTSAALMPEPNSSQYYGQKPADMAKYIHILMPMIYRYGSYNFSDTSFKERSDYYAEQAAKSGGVSWSGIQTYDASTKGMSAEALRRDIDIMAQSKASGVVLFRYQLGTFPDVNDLWN